MKFNQYILLVIFNLLFSQFQVSPMLVEHYIENNKTSNTSSTTPGIEVNS